MLTVRQLKTVAVLTVSLSLLSLIKISSIVGAAAAGFSLSHCLSPLIGILAGGAGAMAFFCVRTCVHVGMAATMPAFVFACHLPTLAAALYLSSLHTTQYTIDFTKKLLLALIPLSCIVLFCIHPVGCQAWAYSLFWVIPVATLFINHTNLFTHMLGSTFTAHAVGSVVWLYCGPMLTPAMWLALIPVVMLERLLLASGMTLGYYALSKLNLKDHTQKIVSFFTSQRA